jgi:hypothetical protein
MAQMWWMFTAGALLFVGSQPAPTPAPVPASWLDRPLANWNAAGRSIARPRAGGDESIDEVTRRCDLGAPRSTAGQRALRRDGWIPFRYFAQDLVREDVEIVGGMAGADGMCRPLAFNVFVFVGGRFAGTLSPVVMNSRLDSVGGPASFAEPGISVEFDRYAASDPLCCPSSKVTVRYRIDRSPQGPVVVPISKAPAP